MNDQQEEELKEAFDLFDGDGSGTMAAKELHVVMQAIGRNMELQEIEANIERLKRERQQTEDYANDNTTPNNELNLEEFIQFISHEMQ